MVGAITFTVFMRPVGKGRPRFGGGRTYTPEKTKSAELQIKYAAAHLPKINGAVCLHVDAYFKTAKSWTSKRKLSALDTPHTQTPDADNILKLVSDALNGVAYGDDAAVSEASISKRWSDEDKIVVTIREVAV